MAIAAQDITSSPFSAGDFVNVRCKVLSIVGTGSGAAVNLVVDTPGNVGERAGVLLTVSSTQCRRSQGVTNSSATGVAN